MAKPELENGYTQIANELMDAFARYFPGGSEAQVLLCILRKTYGWRKKEDSISISQLVNATGLSRRMVIYTLQNLEAKNMIIVRRVRGRGNVNQVNSISLQKNYDKWVVQRKSAKYEEQLRIKRLKYQQGVVQRKGGSATKAQKVVQRNAKKAQIVAPTKETIQKKLQKKTAFVFPEWIDRETWEAFLEMRKKKRQVPTDRAVELLIKELDKLRSEGNNPNEVLNQSIMRNYTGVFPLKGGRNGTYRQAPRSIRPRGSYTKPDDYRT